MEFRQLQYFAAVAEESSFTRAAERLYISQPALSKQISLLEKEFGVTLFTRERRSIRLTEAGGALLPHARSAIAGVQEARACLESYREERREQPEQTEVCIGVETSYMHIERFQRAFSQADAGVHDHYPTLNSSLEIMDLESLTRALRQGRVDLILCTLHDLSLLGDLSSRTIYSSRLSLFFPDRCAMPQNEAELAAILSQNTLIHINDNPNMRAQVDRILRRLEVHPRELVIGDFFAAAAKLIHGDGVMILPEVVMEDLKTEHIRSCPMPDWVEAQSFVLAWERYTPAVDAYGDAFSELLSHT